MRYDPEVRASNCYLEFLRCYYYWERIKLGITSMQGKASLDWAS
jgi:hypothetical protein